MPPPPPSAGGSTLSGRSDETNVATFTSVFVACCVLAALMAAIPLVILEARALGYEYHNVAWVIAGGFTAATVCLCLWEILRHMQHLRNVKMQRQVVRIIWMPFIFSIDSWFALRFKEVGLYFTAAAECYEGWTLFAFMSLLRLYLEDRYQRPGGKELIESIKQPSHIFPLNLLSSWPIRHAPGESVMHGPFAARSQIGVIQYAFVMPVLTIVRFIAQYLNIYKDGTVKIRVVYPYVAAVRNVSQFVALYCIVLYFYAFAKPLAPFRSVPKFLCVKAVVFLTFWQSMLIAGLTFIKVIRANPSWTDYSSQDMAAGVQNFLVCVEMFFAAIAVARYFPPTDYLPPPNFVAQRGKRRWMLRELFSVMDVIHDFKRAVRAVRGKVTPEDDLSMSGVMPGTGGAFGSPWSGASFSASAIALGPVGQNREFSGLIGVAKGEEAVSADDAGKGKGVATAEGRASGSVLRTTDEAGGGRREAAPGEEGTAATWGHDRQGGAGEGEGPSGRGLQLQLLGDGDTADAGGGSDGGGDPSAATGGKPLLPLRGGGTATTAGGGNGGGDGGRGTPLPPADGAGGGRGAAGSYAAAAAAAPPPG